MNRRFTRFAALALVSLGSTAFSFGGWAVITVDELPEALTVGQPTTVSFAVRQHGVKLLGGLKPTLVATDEKGSPEVRVAAVPDTAVGYYVAKLVVPKAGTWTITINSGFMDSRLKLVPMPAVAAARAKNAELSVERGRSLYVAKGCVGCHVHGAITGYPAMAVGPNLTAKRYQPDYLAKLLADPSIARTPGQQNVMPNLGLATSEISALVAFLNADRPVSTR